MQLAEVGEGEGKGRQQYEGDQGEDARIIRCTDIGGVEHVVSEEPQGVENDGQPPSVGRAPDRRHEQGADVELRHRLQHLASSLDLFLLALFRFALLFLEALLLAHRPLLAIEFISFL